MKKNTMMRVASALLVAVLLTTCAISGTFAKYVTSVSSEDQARVAYWGFQSSNSIDITGLFDNSYTSDGITVESEDGKDVIAPGTQNSVDFEFAYAGNTANGIDAPEVAYTFVVDAEITGSYAALDANTNFYWTLTDATGTTTNYQTVAQLLAAIEALDGNRTDNLYKAGELPDMANATCAIGWNWNFGTGVEAEDEADTAMGNAADLNNVKIVITITATQLD